jgi:hypothetical protein
MTQILKYNVFIEHTTKYTMGIIFSYNTQHELSENPNKKHATTTNNKDQTHETYLHTTT